MRFLLPVLSACILSTQAAALAADNAKPSSATPPSNGKKVDASFFLEEVKPGQEKQIPAKTGKPSAAKTPAAKTPAKAAPARAGLLDKIQGQAPSSHFQQGLVMQSMGMSDAAITEYRDALKEDPKFVSTYNNLAQCLVNRGGEGDKEEAIKLLGDAAKLDPNNIGSLHAIAVLKESNKDYTGAQDAYKKILAVQPLNMRAIQNLSEMFYHQNQKDKAREVLNEAIKQHPPEQQLAILKQAILNLDKKPEELKKEQEKAKLATPKPTFKITD